MQVQSEDCLRIESITKMYKHGQVMANSDITTSFYPGQITAVIGHNGAGKTTLLNQIIGVVKPDSGNITYRGYSLIKNTRIAREFVSMMPQLHVPLTGVTVRQSIESVLHIRCIVKKEVKKRTDQILADLNIEKWANQSGDKLSGGLQRLTSFAMAVVCPAPIILLDEPTNDVDPVRRKLIWKIMKKLVQNGHIVAVVTHNLLEVEQYADRYLLFDHGRLIKDALTGSLNQEFPSSTLIAAVDDKSILNNIPVSLNSKFVEDESSIILTLSSDQVIDAVRWVLKMIELGKVTNYKLSTASLDATYGGMTNGQ